MQINPLTPIKYDNLNEDKHKFKHSPNFGMAFIPPKLLEKDIFTKMLLDNTKGYSAELVNKGLRQFCKEQSKITKFDIKFNAEDKSVVVIDNLSNKIMKKYTNAEKQTGFDIPEERHYIGRKILARLFNPKRFLPQNLYMAGEHAKLLQAKNLQ